MKRTLENCRLLKRHSAIQYDGMCEGLCKSPTDDEPCEICKECWLNTSYAETHEPKPKKSRRRFKWDRWNYDCDGEAYIIAKDECPNREDVPEWIIKADHLDPECLNPAHGSYMAVDNVKEGWCKFQVRTDWENSEGEPRGGYVVEERAHNSEMYYQYWQGGTIHRRKSPGWFPVWIVRLGDWY